MGGPSLSTDFESTLERVLTRHIPGLRSLRKAERLTGGASQETYRLHVVFEDGDGLLAMRRAPGGEPPPEDSPNPGLAVEAELMQIAAAHGVPEPEVYYVLQEEDGLGAGFVMQWLEGETLGARINRADEFAEVRGRLAYECGQVLARIHAIDVQSTGLVDKLAHVTTPAFIDQMWQRYQSYGTPQPMIDYTARWLHEHLPPESPPRLVHNDFRNGNLMIGPDGIRAVLDWEVAHIGDPMRDLGWICTNSWRFGNTELECGGFGTLSDLIAGYEAESGDKVDPQHVRYWIVFGSFWWAVGCLSMAARFRDGPDRSVERAAIGRRTSECQVDCVNLLLPGPLDIPSPRPFSATLEMPRLDELVAGVRDFLREEVMPATETRVNFLSRVAANALDIVLRELAMGDEKGAREHTALTRLLGREGDLESLRWALVNALRDGSLPLDTPGLAEYLRNSVATQVAIDQPRYSGYRTALARGGLPH